MAKGIPLMGRGPDGKAKMINVDENGNVKVQQSGTIGLDYPASVARSGSIAGNTLENVLDVTNPIIIDNLKFFCNDDQLIIRFRPYDKNGVTQSRRAVISSLITTTNTRITYVASSAGVFPELSMERSDSENKLFSGRLTKPLYWPRGGRLQVENTQAENASIALVVDYRVMG